MVLVAGLLCVGLRGGHFESLGIVHGEVSTYVPKVAEGGHVIMFMPACPGLSDC